ncbi:MAG: hypothetical protein WCE75_01920 [Terracidiphilus sp.]
MIVGITLEELLNWNHEAAEAWKAHFEANPELLRLDCGVGGAANLQVFARHIWGAELRWGQRIAGLPVTGRDEMAGGPLEAIYAFHAEAMRIFRGLLDRPESFWSESYKLDFDWLPEEKRVVTRRKVAVHAMLHSQRHWAQMATFVRMGGASARFKGDLLFSSTVR